MSKQAGSVDKKDWTPARVRQQLQNAVYLEMWTVPLYLAAAYSIQLPPVKSQGRPEFGKVPTKSDGSPDFDHFSQTNYNQFAFNSVLSVAIQEMLHVELASNLLNAVGPADNLFNRAWVKFTDDWAPNYSGPPACLANAPLPEGVQLRVGPLDLNQARLFQWIEHEDPIPPGDPEAYSETYTSIGDFYTSLMYGMTVCWDELYPPSGKKIKDQKNPTADELFQKDDWGSTLSSMPVSGFTNELQQTDSSGVYGFSIKIYGPPADALKRAQAAMTAIKAQGEGSGAGEDIPQEFQPTQGEPIEIFLDKFTHWDRFTQTLKRVLEGTVQVYSTSAPQNPPLLRDLQNVLNQSLSSFLASLEVVFNDSKASLDIWSMRTLGNRILQIWQNGGVPELKWLNPDDAIDKKRQLSLHACQGLNTCAGLGLDNSGTMAGNGDCATAWVHTCAGSNLCAGQGGCGFARSDQDSKNFAVSPNENSCKNLGNCGAPIPVGQVFADGAMGADGKPAKGDVWAYARKLFIQDMKAQKKKVYAGTLEPNDLRKALK